MGGDAAQSIQQVVGVMADALARLLADDTLRLKMGQVGRTIAVERYDAQQNVKRAENHLVNILG